MKHIFLLSVSVIFVLFTHAQPVKDADFQTVAGTWTGKLTYLDYSSNKEVAIDAKLATIRKKENHYELKFDYPNEPGYGGKDVYRIAESGTMINDMKVIERNTQADGSLKIVLEAKGKDGNEGKAATFNHVLLLSSKKFSITKMVRFDGEEKFFQRNQYVFTR